MSCMQLFASDERRGLNEMQHLLVKRNRKWKVGEVIACSFIRPPVVGEGKVEHFITPRVRAMVQHFAHQWEKFANIKFKFVEDEDMEADIRITLLGGGGSNSYVGTDARSTSLKGDSTMNFGWFTDNSKDKSFARTTMHEFGHVLGCDHEQFSPGVKFTWNEEVVIKYYKDTNDWDEDKVRLNFNNFLPVDAKDYDTTDWDRRSIMHYSVKKEWNYEGIEVEWVYTLSDIDKNFIGEAYPFKTILSNESLLEQSSFSAVDVYEYQHAKMYLNLFCQGESGKLYSVVSIYRDKSATVIPNPVCETRAVATDAVRRTPLASAVHYDGPGIPTVHLFYVDRNQYISEITWVNGEQTTHKKLNAKASLDSDLSVLYWKEEGQTKLRLYFQGEDNRIHEWSGSMSEDWMEGWDLDFGNDAALLSGSSLSFVNLSLDKPNVRAFWQSSKTGLVRMAKYEGEDWDLTKTAIDHVPYHAPLAAVLGSRKTQEVALYYTNASKQVVKFIVDANKSEVIDRVPTDISSNLAVVSCDAGIHVFVSDRNHIVKKVASKDGGAFVTTRIKLASGSNLIN